jgi:hypothetical protein
LGEVRKRSIKPIELQRERRTTQVLQLDTAEQYYFELRARNLGKTPLLAALLPPAAGAFHFFVIPGLGWRQRLIRGELVLHLLALEGLRLAELDVRRGVLDPNSSQRIRAAVEGLVADLSDFDDVAPPLPASDEASAFTDTSQPKKSQSVELPVLSRDELRGSWASPTAVLCIPGPSPLDEAATLLLTQILEKHGIGVKIKKHQAVSSGSIFHLSGEGVAIVCLSYLDNGDARARVRAAIRRVQRQLQNATVLVGLWGPNKDESGALRSELKASFYAYSLREAAKICIKVAQRPRYWAA